MSIGAQPPSAAVEPVVPKRRLPIARLRTRAATPSATAALNLQDADLHDRDLRGLDFTGANLRGADLRRVRTGMRPSWAAMLVTAALVLAVLIGAASGIAGRWLQQLIVDSDPVKRFLGVFTAAQLIVFLVAAVWKGLRPAALWLLPPLASVVLAGTIVAVSTGGTGLVGLAVVALSASTLALVAMGALARTVAGTAGAMLFAVVAISGALAGRALGGGLTALALAVSAMIIGRRALRASSFAPLLHRWSVAISCAGGTSFRHADLGGARFDDATLECSDFRAADIEATHFEGAKVQLCAFDEPPVLGGSTPTPTAGE